MITYIPTWKRLAALAVLIIFPAACGPSRFASPFLDVAVSITPITDSTATATATCPAPELRIGGGFNVSTDASIGVVVRGSHPNSANGWTVEVANTNPTTSANPPIVEAVAYCLDRADLKPTITVQPAEGMATLGVLGSKMLVRASCPAGSVLTGGGYEVDGELTINDALYNAGVEGSFPYNEAVWQVDAGQYFHASGSRAYHAFAVCASSPLKAGVPQTVAVTPVFGVVTNVVSPCPTTAFTTAGGFKLNAGADGADATQSPSHAFTSVAESEFANWTVMASSYAPSTLTSVALCTPNL